MKKFLLLITALVAISACTSHVNVDPKHKLLSFALSDDAKSLDPANAYDAISLTVMPLAMESLYQYNFLKKPLMLEPLLAESMPTISKDQKTYTIKIKKGVMFQDDPAFPGGKGRELKANDFIYAWKRMLLPKLQSNGTWIFEDKVVGYNELKQRYSEDKTTPVEELLALPMEGMRALNDYTLQIKLTRAYPQLLHVIAMGFGAPVAKEVTDKYGHEGLTEKMVGTGPYQLKKVVRGSQITLVKNPTFHGEKFQASKEAPALALPFIDEINFQIIKEQQPVWLKFQKGQLDLAGIPKDNFDAAIKDGKLAPELSAKGIALIVDEEPSLWYLTFNMKDKLLGTNVNLRKAIVRAIDRDYMIKLFLNGRGIKATSMIPKGTEGHTAREKTIGDFNLDEAKMFLAKAGYPEGKGLPPIKFDLRGSSTTSRQQAEYISKALEKIGVKIQVEVNTFPAFLEKAKNGHLQFFFGGWNLDYPDPENVLQLLYGKNISPGPNDANYSNPEYDKLYEKIAAMLPSKARTDLIKKAEDIAFEDTPWSMLYYPITYRLSHGWVKNYHPDLLILNDLKYLDIDNEMMSLPRKVGHLQDQSLRVSFSS